MSDYRNNYEVNLARRRTVDGKCTSVCEDCWTGVSLSEKVRAFWKLKGIDIGRDYRYLVNRVKDTYYWVRHRTVDKYHVVRTGLEPGYYDKDTQMIHACFNLLVEFVDREQPWAYCQDLDASSLKEKNEIMGLYNWWKLRRDREDHVDYEESDRLHEEDQRQLHKLIDLRPRLWT
jgi:hypothetical protein